MIFAVNTVNKHLKTYYNEKSTIGRIGIEHQFSNIDLL
ncbi:Hypothetical protein I595_1400 [Croceitalea dokdonensis DOKDO 023]|uniref:Uncharacterized protein n=1 Tax=Croceitalea dokdonensis DOKDO 023 TaxID=1300341 RepID=A0A0P7B3C3_9FLAO|nr:Hypothetical protein I595_1400 [Croceitalea dokdonensis DOKDO 023]